MSNLGLRRSLFAATAAVALVAGGQAFARQAQPVAVAPEASSNLGELVVTAQLREQRALEVPFALTAYSGKDLADLGIQEFDDLSQFVPGFEVQNQSPNNPGFVMRGITSDSGEATTEPRVSVFQDGVSISKSRGSYIELFDIERVEIAKGPQSTLYGRGALIGGVNIIQNKAKRGVFALSGQAEAGDNGYWLAEAAVNAPLGENAAVRLSARIKQRDGYVDNLAGGEAFNSTDTQAVRGAFNWTGDALRLDVIGNYQKDTPSGTSFRSGAYEQTDPVTGAVLAGTNPSDGAYLTGASGIEGGKALGLDRDVWGVTGIARYEISPALSLNSITAYREFNALEVFDADGISLQALTAAEEAKGKQTSQEFRLNFAPADSRFSGFAGLSLFHEEGTQRTPAQFDERVLLARLAGALNGGGAVPGRPANDPAPGAVFGSTVFTGALLQGVAGAYGYVLSAPVAQGIAANLVSNHVESQTNGSDTDSVDVFADGTFKATDKLELSAGVRYSHDDKTSTYSAAVLNGRSILGGFIGALGLTEPNRTGILNALAAPGAATIPMSVAYPVPLFGLGAQPTTNNGDVGTANLKDDGFTWRATARYAVTDEFSLYANYGRGRRPEVLSARSPAAPGGAPTFTSLPAETVDSYEVGAKTRLMDGKLSLEGAVFHYDYKNFQSTEQIGTTFVTTNAGEAKSDGLEAQARFAVTDHFDVFGTYAYNKSRFQTGIRKGNHLRLSPDNTLSIGAAVRAPLFGGQLEIRPTYTWQSEVFFDDDNDLPALQQPPRGLVADNIQDERQKGYGLANLRIEYSPAHSDWKIGLFATNLFDERYIKDAGNTGDAVGLATFIAGEPRFVGVSVSFRR